MGGKLIIVTCVVVMTLGQPFFKQVAINYNKIQTLVDSSILGLFYVAVSIYLASSQVWVRVLQSVKIFKAYPYFALRFVFVPLLGAWLFGESLIVRYGLGVMLIAIGVSLTSTT